MRVCRVWVVRLGIIPVLLVVGCAQRTVIASTPAGARVTINNRYVGTTPIQYEVRVSEWPPDNIFDCRLELEGYNPTACTFRGARSEHIVGNILSFGILRIFRGPYGFRSQYRFELAPLSGLQQLDYLRARGLITDEEYKKYQGDLIRKAIEGGKPLVP